MIMEDSKIEMHMGQAKWAEMAAWECLDDGTKKEIILRNSMSESCIKSSRSIISSTRLKP